MFHKKLKMMETVFLGFFSKHLQYFDINATSSMYLK